MSCLARSSVCCLCHCSSFSRREWLFLLLASLEKRPLPAAEEEEPVAFSPERQESSAGKKQLVEVVGRVNMQLIDQLDAWQCYRGVEAVECLHQDRQGSTISHLTVFQDFQGGRLCLLPCRLASPTSAT